MESTRKILDLTTTLIIAGTQLLALWMRRGMHWLQRLRVRPATERSRADVPGWVLITLMSAILVAGLLAIAGPALEKLFTEAMDQVRPGD